MANPSLRPLSIGEILDAGIKVVTRHWKPLVTCIVGLVAPLYIVYVLVLASVDPDQLTTENTFSTSSSTSGSDDAAVLVGSLVSAFLLVATFVIAFTACFKAVSDAWLGAQPEVGRSLRFGLRRSPMLVVLFIVYSIPVGIGLLLCLVPGIWLTVCWLVCIPAMLFERVGPFKALGRSYSLIQQRWWASFLLLIVCYLLATIVSFVIQFGLLGIAAVVAEDSVLAGAVAQVVGSTVSTAITYPYLAAVLTILYFDQRVRKEGFDLQLQAEGFPTNRDPDAPLPAPLIGDELYTPEQRAAAPYWPPPPGWVPPPAQSEWSSSSGWSPPSPDREEKPLWGTSGDPLRRDDEAPPDPLPPRDEDEPPPSYPGWSGTTAPGAKRDDDDDDDDKPGRAGWLPPEAPRGPGGL